MEISREYVIVSPRKIQEWVLSETEGKGKTQTWLANELGVNQGTISTWAKGNKKSLSPESIRTIGKYLKTSNQNVIKMFQEGFVSSASYGDLEEKRNQNQRVLDLEQSINGHSQIIEDLLVMVRHLDDRLQKLERSSKNEIISSDNAVKSLQKGKKQQ